LKKSNVYDCIIIGAGPSGVQAGIYLARANKKVLVVFSKALGSLLEAKDVENFYGVTKLSGEDVYQNGIKQLERLNVDMIDTEISSVRHDFDSNLFFVSDGKSEFVSKTLVLAMGKETKKKADYEISATSGVSYCALCDGFFFKHKKIAVVGNGEFAFSEFKHLLDVTDNVTLLTNGKTLSKVPSFVQNINKLKLKSIGVGKNTNVCVIFEDESKQEFDGLFIAEGKMGTGAISKILGVAETADGHILVDENMKTNIPGLFACGDMVGMPYQIAKAVADGMRAGLSVINFLNK